MVIKSITVNPNAKISLGSPMEKFTNQNEAVVDPNNTFVSLDFANPPVTRTIKLPMLEFIDSFNRETIEENIKTLQGLISYATQKPVSAIRVDGTVTSKKTETALETNNDNYVAIVFVLHMLEHGDANQYESLIRAEFRSPTCPYIPMEWGVFFAIERSTNIDVETLDCKYIPRTLPGGIVF